MADSVAELCVLRALRRFAAVCESATAAALGSFRLGAFVFSTMEPTKRAWAPGGAAASYLRATFPLWCSEAAAAGLIVDRGYTFYSLKRVSDG